MKWTIIVVFCIIAVNYAKAQKQLFMTTNDSQCPVNIASAEIHKAFSPPPEINTELKSATEQGSEIIVTFIDFPEEAKSAFLYATSIWESLLSTPVPINVVAKWESLSNNVVSKSRPSLNFRTFEGSRVPDVYYPVALVEKLSGYEMNRGEPDIICSFNKNMPWYFGTNGNTPETKYDFVTAVLHEITHGLGFHGFFNDNNGSGYFNNANNLPSIFDYFVFNEMNQQISNKTIFNSPSVELHHQLTSNKLKLYKPEVFTNNQKILDWIYAPPVWEEGTSIYHFNTSQTSSKLMSAVTRKGEAIHHPGENTLAVLSEIGWESVAFIFDELKDHEQPCNILPIQIGINSDIQIDSLSFKLFFSVDNFSTKKYINLNFNSQTKQFTGNIPLNYFQGVVQYYFQIYTAENHIINFPSTAPEKIFSFRVGPDYYPPEISHNPLKIISQSNSKLNITAIANDNIGVENVKIEYKINGITKEPIELANDSADYYLVQLVVSEKLNSADRLEYRLVAKDKSVFKNTKTDPVIGFYNVKIYNPLEPVHEYYNDFHSSLPDFVLSDFASSRPVGFNNGILHTENPYKTSKIKNEYYNHLALLKYPVILKENGLMKFDEIVLVEPGEIGTSYNSNYFWDYAIVEGSKDNGQTWLPFSEGYDSKIQDLWYSEFENSIINYTSTAPGLNNMFIKHTFNLTENQNFSEGDTVLIRFRLASDNSVNGWGWAIDNLDIQTSVTGVEDILSAKSVKVYPNPFKDILNIENKNVNSSPINKIIITNILGETVFIEKRNEMYSDRMKQINLANLKQGIYLVNLVFENSEIITKKIIKK